MASIVGFGSVGLLAVALFAFWPSYIAKPFPSIDLYTHLHAAIGVLWLLLLALQGWLIATNRRSAHGAIGRASYVIAPSFVLSAVLLAHFRSSRMDDATFAQEAYTLYLPLSAALLFGAAWTMAMLNR